MGEIREGKGWYGRRRLGSYPTEKAAAINPLVLKYGRVRGGREAR